MSFDESLLRTMTTPFKASGPFYISTHIRHKERLSPNNANFFLVNPCHLINIPLNASSLSFPKFPPVLPFPHTQHSPAMASSSSSSHQWNNTIDDTSPLFSYSPYCQLFLIVCLFSCLTNVLSLPPADGTGLQNGWQSWYTVSGFNSRAGDVPAGDSSRITSLPGASVSLNFFGKSNHE